MKKDLLSEKIDKRIRRDMMLVEKNEIHTLRSDVSELSEQIREQITSLGGALLEKPSLGGNDPKLTKALSAGQNIEDSIKSYLTKVDDIEDIKEQTKKLTSDIKSLKKDKAKCCDDMSVVYISIGRNAFLHYKDTGQSTVATDKYYKEIIREQEKLETLQEKMSDQELEPEKNIISVIVKKSKVTFTDSRIKAVNNLIENLFKKAGAEFSETNLFDELIDSGKVNAIEKYKVLKDDILTIDNNLSEAKEEKESLIHRSRTEYGVKGLTVALLEINKELNLLKDQYEEALSEIGYFFMKGSEKGDSQTINLRAGIVRIEKEEAEKQALLDKLLAQEEIASITKDKDHIEKKISGVEAIIAKNKTELKVLKKEIAGLEKELEEQREIVEKNT